jgi:putative ABC transport system permease protein
MVSAFVKKSWGDLSRKKGRAVLTILTIILGVAGMGMFAMSPMMNKAIVDQMEASNLMNLELTTKDIPLNGTVQQGLSDIDNVKEFEPSVLVYSKIYIGERRADALILGLPSFEHQQINKITIKSGKAPTYMEVLTTESNKVSGNYKGAIGSTIKVIDSNGTVLNLTVSGVAGGLTNGPTGAAIFFTDLQTARALGNLSGFNVLDFTLDNTDDASMKKTVDDVNQYLKANTDFDAFTSLPMTRKAGHWGGEEAVGQMLTLFYGVTFLILLCSVFLIASTMNTIIAEQKKEIAQLKAIGGTRAQVFRSYLTTSLILGIIGSTIGSVVGNLIAMGFVSYMGSVFGITLYPVPHIPTLVVSIIVGVCVTVGASLPALFRGSSITIKEGMNGQGISGNYGEGWLDRALLRTKVLPRMSGMGLRNIARKKGRTASTTIQVALAVGTLLAVVCLGMTVTKTVEDEYDYMRFDLSVSGQMNGARPFTEDIASMISSMDGVSAVEPSLGTMGLYHNKPVFILSYPANDKMYNHARTLVSGRWLQSSDHAANATNVVVGKGFSDKYGVGLGDSFKVTLATGASTFKVVGIDSGQRNNGQIVHMPMSTLQGLLHMENIVSDFLVKTNSSHHKDIDKLATKLEDTMISQGFVVQVSIMYVLKELNVQSNLFLTNSLILVGMLVVAITMVGLMSTLTMNVLERTKEIGMLRCLGAKAGQIKSVFRTEGLVIAVLGWAIGVPLGYVIGQALNLYLHTSMNLQMTFLYPPEMVLLSLGLTLLMTLGIIYFPIRRAVRFKPGEALRYQ